MNWFEFDFVIEGLILVFSSKYSIWFIVQKLIHFTVENNWRVHMTTAILIHLKGSYVSITTNIYFNCNIKTVKWLPISTVLRNLYSPFAKAKLKMMKNIICLRLNEIYLVNRRQSTNLLYDGLSWNENDSRLYKLHCH